MAYKIIMVLAALFALYRLTKSRDAMANLVSLLMIGGVTLVVLGVELLVTIGLGAFLFGLFIAMVYGAFKIGVPPDMKRVILGMAILTFPGLLFSTLHLPGAGWLGLLNVIPLFIYLLIVLPKRKRYAKEWGFLTLIFGEALVEFSMRMVLILDIPL